MQAYAFSSLVDIRVRIEDSFPTLLNLVNQQLIDDMMGMWSSAHVS